MIFASSVVSGTFITIIVIATAPVLKNYLITYRQLLRLDTLSHPLLLRLQQEAPSTFQHSLHVANLGHKAAKAIGADAFLTRIGGYYHDVGKMSDPKFFIENRSEQDNLDHSDSINTKVKKIHAHIKNGVKLAREYNLPQEVIKFIPEHHGTMLAVSLYNEAMNAKLHVFKKDFRYLGPKPLSKETAIIMIADGIESSVRALPETSKTKITEAVNSIIDNRLADKQLELSGLTQNDIKKIRASLIEGASIVHHPRIKYPELIKNDKS